MTAPYRLLTPVTPCLPLGHTLPRRFPSQSHLSPLSHLGKELGRRKQEPRSNAESLGLTPVGHQSGHLGVLQNVLGGAAKDQLPQPAQSRSGSICRKVERGTPKCLATWVGFTPARSADRIALRFVSGISRLPRSARPLDRPAYQDSDRYGPAHHRTACHYQTIF